MSQLQVHLYRDSFTTPWGIRLQGGKDVGQALVIQRVFANSPAEGYLQRGDIILNVNNCEASELSHKKAQDLFNSAGGQILLTIKRGQYFKKEPPKPKDPKPKTSVSASAGQKMAPTLKSKRKVGSKSPSSAKSKDIAYGGGGLDFGLDYSKVKVDANYVPGPIFNEEEAEQDDMDQAYRTVPLELTGPGGISGPKFGGSSIDLGVNYNKLAGRPVETIMQRQSSKPWEDQEMLYKVHDTLSHISYPYAPPGASITPAAPGAASKISCVNMYPSAPQSAMAPPPYTPGPPVEPESNYVDPFPSYKPPQVADYDEEEYEFVPVRQRRNQFNKSDFSPQERKPIKPQRPPPVYAPAPPAPAPKPISKPVTPTPAPISYSAPAPFMPAEGEVVKPAVPAWAGTLTNVGGPKLWDAGMKPSSTKKPARSGSPTKKPVATGDFKPTQTQVMDFTGESDDGPRIMHLQYNSPLDMYSRENVAETLQGQTQAALGGGNTVRRRRRRQIAAFLTGPADELVKTSAESVEPAEKQAPEVPPATAPKPLPKPVTEPKSKPVSVSVPEPVPKSDPVLIAKANIEEPAKQVIISKPPAAREPKVDASRQQSLKAAPSPKPSEVSVTPPKRSEFVPKTSEKPIPRSPLSQARTAQMKERTKEGKESKDSSLPRWLIPLILFILLGAAVAALFLYREQLHEKYPAFYELIDQAVITVRGREIESSSTTEELSLPDVAEAASQVMESVPSAEDLVSDVSENVETVLDQGD